MVLGSRLRISPFGTRIAPLWALLAALLAVGLSPRVARACSCMMPPPPKVALTDADAVFEARAYSLSTDDRRARYRFEVDRVWKGAIEKRVEIATALNSAACGRSYKIGAQYVIYARRGPSGDWTDGLCSRTRTSTTAAEDLDVLGEGRPPIDPDAAPPPEDGDAPHEPPRIDPPPVEPPPPSPSARGCSVHGVRNDERTQTPWVLMLIAIAIGRRRTVRSPASRSS